MKKIQLLYAKALFHLLVMKESYLDTKQYMSMYIRSRLRIIGIKIFPPKRGLDLRLEMDSDALFTMSSDETDKYQTWLTKLREAYYRKELKEQLKTRLPLTRK